jgi:DNA primase
VIAFGARALAEGDEPKYLNSPETAIYKKKTVLYNLHRAKPAVRSNDQVILVEGYMDVIGVYGAGVKEVVASCGTALDSAQVRALRLHSDRIVVNFDPDPAGANAAERSINLLLAEHMHVRILELSEGLDPDEYIKEHGVEAYRARLAKAANYFHWLADRARAKFDLRTAEGRFAGFQFLLPAILQISDKVERAAIASDVADYLNIDRGLVLEQFRKAAAERTRLAPAATRAQQPQPLPAEKLLLTSLLSSREAREAAIPELQTSAIGTLTCGRILQAIIQIHQSDAAFDFSHLDSRLEEGDRALLAGVLFADELEGDQNAVAQAMACVRLLQQSDRQARAAELKSQARAAERGGNVAEALWRRRFG